MFLQGLNIGGYLSQAEFSNEHVKGFFTEEDMKRIEGWGFNVVRLPVDYFFFEDDNNPYSYIEDRMRQIDRVLSWAQKSDVALILDLHKAPGHSFDPRERGSNDIWDNRSVHRNRFLKAWDMLSKRYRKFNKIIYEVMNEPVAPKDAFWLELAEDTIKTIRANDKEHFIVVESNLWGRAATFKNMRKFADSNVVYSFHYYEPILITHQFAEWIPFYDLYRKHEKYPGKIEGLKDLKDRVAQKDKEFAGFLDYQEGEWNKEALERAMTPVLAFKEKFNVPILCGEFGCVAKADPQTRVNWTNDVVSLFKKHGISYTYWSYKNMDFGLYDFTEKYADNPNYANEERLDRGILSSLR
jgi:aryl-phospho-beta-D-glucosidase BglC (GH1 family)